MSIHTTYSKSRANFASLWDQVTDNREIIIIKRRGSESVALISTDELEGLLETAHLLRSPKNKERLLNAINRAKQNQGTSITTENLRKDFSLDELGSI